MKWDHVLQNPNEGNLDPCSGRKGLVTAVKKTFSGKEANGLG